MGESSELSGCSVLITGAAKRIGRAVALRLARAGANIVIHRNRSKQEAESAAEEIRRLGVKSWILTADLSLPAEAESLVSRAIEVAGPLDFLVNNASRFEPSSLEGFGWEEFMSDMRVNALAPLVLGRAFMEQGRPGAIVNFLDTRVMEYDMEHVAYHLSKRTLLSLTKMMALEFAPVVRVNAVAPGFILPPAGKDQAYLERLARSIPLNRAGSTNHVAGAVLFLLTNDFITGQVLYVDGGYHLKGRTYE
jgi:pteridine reductase